MFALPYSRDISTENTSSHIVESFWGSRGGFIGSTDSPVRAWPFSWLWSNAHWATLCCLTSGKLLNLSELVSSSVKCFHRDTSPHRGAERIEWAHAYFNVGKHQVQIWHYRYSIKGVIIFYFFFLEPFFLHSLIWDDVARMLLPAFLMEAMRLAEDPVVWLCAVTDLLHKPSNLVIADNTPTCMLVDICSL